MQRPWEGSLYQQWALVPVGTTGAVQLVSRGNDKGATLAADNKFNVTPLVGQTLQNRPDPAVAPV